MKEVEKRLDLVTGRKEIGQEINQGERDQLLALADRLVEPDLVLSDRIEIVSQMRRLLSGKGMLMEGTPKMKTEEDHGIRCLLLPSLG
jgi:hypothetical protein